MAKARNNLLLLGVGAAAAALIWQNRKGVQKALKIYQNDAGQIEVRQGVTVGKPLAEVYAYWRDFSHLPEFTKHVERVEVLSETRSKWYVKAPTGTVQWEAEITDDQPPAGGAARIAWHTLPGSGIQNEGEVRFREAPGGRGTEVITRLAYSVAGGAATATLARLFGLEPSQAARGDLTRLKRQLELGFQPTVQGQSSGRAKDQATPPPTPDVGGQAVNP